MLNILLFGPPGVGKGTQAVRISEKYNLTHLSTGDMFRDEMKAGTDLGKEVKKIIDNGELVSDEIVFRVLVSKMLKTTGSKGFVFDGFPRTLQQAEMLDKMLDEKFNPITVIISLESDEETLMERMLKRALESGRADDTEDVIRNRFSIYKKQTFPILDYFKEHGKLETLNGIGTIDDIFEKIKKIVDIYL